MPVVWGATVAATLGNSGDVVAIPEISNSCHGQLDAPKFCIKSREVGIRPGEFLVFSVIITIYQHLGTGWCVSVSQPPAEVCLTDLAWDYPGV